MLITPSREGETGRVRIRRRTGSSGFSFIVDREEVVRLICSSAISTIYAAAIAAAAIAAVERKRSKLVVVANRGTAVVGRPSTTATATDDLKSSSTMDCLSCELCRGEGLEWGGGPRVVDLAQFPPLAGDDDDDEDEAKEDIPRTVWFNNVPGSWRWFLWLFNPSPFRVLTPRAVTKTFSNGIEIELS